MKGTQPKFIFYCTYLAICEKKNTNNISSTMYIIGVAWASSIIASSAHIVMPVDSSEYKIEELLDMYGAGVTICGNRTVDRLEAAEKLLVEHPNWKFVHPGDWKVLAGQGTVGLEVIEQVESMLMNGTSLVAGEELICPWGLKCISVVYICLRLALA